MRSTCRRAAAGETCGSRPLPEEVTRSAGTGAEAGVLEVTSRETPGPRALLDLNLTPREAEVLYWVSEGKTNPEIALILGSSRRTVEKHVEHILEKLGVETRTAAANLALGRMRGT